MNLLPRLFLAADPAPVGADPLTRALADQAAQPGAQEILLAILFSFALNALVAWTYKRTYRGTRYSQDYVHTLLILGTVVTLVILVVVGNLAAAFGMFAAFSIIRFRRTVGQSRDIGFIFLAMGTGLAVGARQYALAAITVPLVCAIVFLLSRADLFSSLKGSHLLRLRVGTDVDYDQAFVAAFARFVSHQSLKSVETVQAGLMTELRYEVTLKDGANVGEFVRALQAANGNNRVLLTCVGDQSVVDAE
jgi:putative flippase GtrA